MTPELDATPDADLGALFGAPTRALHRPRWPLADNAAYATEGLATRTVFVRRAALRAMCATAARHAVEVAFLCMGRRACDTEGPYTVIEAFALVGVGSAAHVEMPVDAKVAAQRRHAALDVVGWAHTHPGLGVFFSRTDVANCAQYGPDAVNFVCDPVRGELGIALGDAIVRVVPIASARTSTARGAPADESTRVARTRERHGLLASSASVARGVVRWASAVWRGGTQPRCGARPAGRCVVRGETVDALAPGATAVPARYCVVGDGSSRGRER